MGPDLNDFLSQIPAFIIVVFCGSGLLLLVSVIVIIRARMSKAQENYAQLVQAIERSHTPAAPFADQSADLPDLDLLVGSPPAPAPVPVPARAPEPAPRTPRKGLYTVSLSDGGSTEAVEVMAIMRDVVDGGLIVQMGDKTYRNLSSDEAFKNGFLKVMRELSPMVKGSPAPAAPPEDSAEDAPEAAPSVRDLMDEAQPAPIPPPAPRPAPAPRPRSGSMPGALPSYSLDEQPLPIPKKKGLFGRGKLELPPVPELDIAGRIEAFLQHKLTYTPEYAGRSIHVHPAPDDGVMIEVDGAFYESVGEVADDGVRAFLAATIQEWQQQNG